MDLPDPANPLPDIVVMKGGAWYCRVCGDRMFPSHRDRVPLHCSNESVYCPGSVAEIKERIR